MNCELCDKLVIKNVGSNAKGEPYKFACKMDVFPHLKSNDKYGKSYSANGYEYYSKNQFEEYIANHKNRFCRKKYNITNSNIISVIAFAVSVVSIFTNLSKKDENTMNQIQQLNDKYIVVLKQVKSMNDSLTTVVSKIEQIEDLNMSRKQDLLELKGRIKNKEHLVDSVKYEDDNNE